MTASSATKKRCWSFHVTGVNRKKASKIKEASVFSSFRERYTAVRRLALSSSTTTTTTTAGVNGAKSSPGGVGSSRTVCIEVQFIGPQPSQGPGALLCNLLSGTSVEARPIELRRGRDNNNNTKRKRTDSGSDEGSDPEAEDGRVGKIARPDVLRRKNGLHVKRPSLMTADISPGRHPLQVQDVATYIKVSDELEQVPAPKTRPVYLTPLSLKALASFPAHPSSPLNEIPPSTPPSQVPPSSPPSDDVSASATLPFLTARTGAPLPRFAPREDAPLPSVATRADALPLSTLREDAPLPFLTPRNSVVGLPESNSRNRGVPSPLLTSSRGTASLTPPRGSGAPLPPSTLRNNDAGASQPTPSSDNAGVGSSSPDSRMHWEDVIGRIYVPPPSRGVLGRQHSLDIGDIGSSSDGEGDGEGDFDDATDRFFFSSAGSSGGKESQYDEEDAAGATTAAAATASATAQGRITSHHIDGSAGGIIGCTTAPFCDPPLTFDMADELLDPPSGSVHQRGLPSSESARSFTCAREILRGASFQCSDHIGLDDIHGTYGAVVDGDPHKDSFVQHSRNSSTSSGLDSTTALSGCGADGGAEGVHRVSLPSTPALVSCGATGQPNVVVGLAREFQECDFEGHHLPSLSSAPAFSGGHYQVVIDGLDTVGHAPQELVTTAHFSVDSSYKVGRRASPIRVGANGKSHAALFYPSMQDVWPEVYITSNIRTVEVDVTVDIRSRDGTFHHTTPNLKVIYRRTPFYCAEE